MTAPIAELSCQELVKLITDYVEGALPEADHKRFEEHLEMCDDCRAYLGQIRTTIRLTGMLRTSDLSPEVSRTLHETFRTWKARSQV